MIDQELRAAFVAALRDPERKQVRGRLRSGKAMCATGVACDVYAAAHPDEAWWENDDTFVFQGETWTHIHPFELEGLAGLNLSGIQVANDNGRTFAEIAAKIERGEYDYEEAA